MVNDDLFAHLVAAGFSIVSLAICVKFLIPLKDFKSGRAMLMDFLSRFCATSGRLIEK